MSFFHRFHPRGLAWCLAVTAVLLIGRAVSAAVVQSFTYQEPFGLPHSKELLEFKLNKQVNSAQCRLLDAAGKEVAYQILGMGTRCCCAPIWRPMRWCAGTWCPGYRAPPATRR